jgi:ACS family D-galactonate transporter-like MFS transporter
MEIPAGDGCTSGTKSVKRGRLMSRRWILVVLIFCGTLISYVDRTSLSIASATIMREFHLSPALAGVLLSAFFWTYATMQIPAGLLVDRFGARWTYASAFTLWSLTSAAMALSRGFFDLMGLRLLLGLAETVGPIASLSLIRRSFSVPEQGLPTSMYFAGQTFGPALAALVGSVLLAHFGWRVMFAVTGLVALVWIPFWFSFFPKDETSIAPPGAFTPKPHLSGRWLLRSFSFWSVSGCVFCLAYYWYFVLTWIPAYLSMARHFSVMTTGTILSIPLFAMTGVSIASGWLADKLIARTGNVFAVRLRFAILGLLGAALMLLLNFIPGRVAVLPVLTVSICSFGVANSSFWTLVQNTSPAGLVARVIGYLNTVSQLGGVTAPLITGWSLGPRKNFGLAIALAGLTPLVTCLLLLLTGAAGMQKLKSDLSASQA